MPEPSLHTTGERHKPKPRVTTGDTKPQTHNTTSTAISTSFLPSPLPSSPTTPSNRLFSTLPAPLHPPVNHLFPLPLKNTRKPTKKKK
ncbi:unnamed protein product [Tuber melanosporum]|uniref:(Perigord truffle) hypothetical protein n=1 Tax=Tuber melanosporum (strain Mel28) TaxID=656061 RepID=D5G947_TUBMM|nr:uncharacterized protein GSTUM_00003124001 [Tuber melanosporum]CAZ81040.1 unnamed protein product [Tuber melanosporum]